MMLFDFVLNTLGLFPNDNRNSTGIPLGFLDKGCEIRVKLMSFIRVQCQKQM